jgi:hypothetical protein
MSSFLMRIWNKPLVFWRGHLPHKASLPLRACSCKNGCTMNCERLEESGRDHPGGNY